MEFNEKVIAMVRLKVGNQTGYTIVDSIKFDVSWSGEFVVARVCLLNPEDPTDLLLVYDSSYPDPFRWIGGLASAPWVSVIESVLDREIPRLREEIDREEELERIEREIQNSCKIDRFSRIWESKFVK